VPGIAIESYLINKLPVTAPSGFAVLRTTFEGLPHELTLSDRWSAIVYAPTGMARVWLDGDPADVVSASQQEFLPHTATDDRVACSARLVIRRGGAPLGALPLAAGVIGTFRAPSALLEIVPLSWEIRVGAMRGGSPGGARIELAWRSRIVPPGVLTGVAAPRDSLA
jgi:hypothetical protein